MSIPVFRHWSEFLLLAAGMATAACTTSAPPHARPGKKLKLETVTHDWQTTYVYREVDDSGTPKR